jgi:hypothetical protein
MQRLQHVERISLTVSCCTSFGKKPKYFCDKAVGQTSFHALFKPACLETSMLVQERAVQKLF